MAIASSTTIPSATSVPDIHPDNYDFLRECIYRDSGIVLDNDKHYLLEARLTPILHEKHLESLNDLCALLQATGNQPLRQQVVEAMTTNETFFFRDLGQYNALRSVILPPLIVERQRSRRVNFWSAAASTGQEAYSLAMMLLEMGLDEGDVQILGTDLTDKVIRRARAGEYAQIEVNRGLPAALLVKYFHQAGLNWKLRDEVRHMVHFTRFDLRQSMHALGPFDVVFCRNVLIYFDVETKKQILHELHGRLFSGGYLLLGGSETTLGLSDQFEPATFGSAMAYRAK